VKPPSVRGGAGGIEARHSDLLSLGRLYDQVGDDVRRSASQLAALVADLADEPQLVIAAVLSPGTAARAVAETGDAAGRLLPLAVTTEGHARFLRTAVQAYRAADELLERAAQLTQDATGVAVGVAAPGLALAGGAAYLASLGVEGLAEVVGWESAALWVDGARDAAIARGEQLLVEHPGAVEHVAGGAAGLEQGVMAWLPPGLRPLAGAAGLGFPRTFDDAVGDLALFFPDGRPVLHPGGRWQLGDVLAPHSVRDLLEGVDRRQTRGEGEGPALPGEIGIVKLVAPDGTVRWVVQLPGTESWDPRPGSTARDLSTNLHTMAGDSTVYIRGIQLAMDAAGVGRGDAVMLVGHSQGGMTAAALAADPAVRERFHITHVVTAGSPVARTDVPPSVQVLALENRYDLVPRLDGRSNEAPANITTVTFDDQHGSAGANHALSNYAALADSLPRDDPSVRAWHDSAAGFLDERNTVTDNVRDDVDWARVVITRELP
jgi:PGAP1-like protein